MSRANKLSGIEEAIDAINFRFLENIKTSHLNNIRLEENTGLMVALDILFEIRDNELRKKKG